MRRLRRLLALLCASTAAWTVASTAEATGGIDATYGVGGRAVVVGPSARFSAGAAATPDGGAVLAGGGDEPRPRLLLARLDAAGRPVRSFGREGVVVRPGRVPGAVAVLPDGRVLAAGSAPGARRDRLALLRFDERGRPDPTFGRRGEVLRSFGNGRRPAAFALLILPDGRILVAGTEAQDGVDDDYGRLLLARFLSDGRPDAGFGRNGAVRMRLARRTAAAVFALALTTDGKILAAGDTQTVDKYGDLLEEGMLIARFDSAGRPDRSFGSGGTGVVDLGGRIAQGSAVAALPDGRVLVAGSLEVDSRDPELGGSDALVARVDRDGRLDRSFGRQGVIRLRAGDAGFAGASALRVEADGRILLAGSATDCGTSSALVARLLPEGQIDRSFGRRGALLVPSAAGDFNPTSLLPVNDGRLVVAGVAGFRPGRLEAARRPAHNRRRWSMASC